MFFMRAGTMTLNNTVGLGSVAIQQSRFRFIEMTAVTVTASGDEILDSLSTVLLVPGCQLTVVTKLEIVALCDDRNVRSGIGSGTALPNFCCCRRMYP